MNNSNIIKIVNHNKLKVMFFCGYFVSLIAGLLRKFCVHFSEILRDEKQVI